MGNARSRVLLAGTAMAVGLGYFVGANLGFILRLPPQTPSVMWPPNAILTAALLIVPVRRWWIYLLAAFPFHLAAEIGAQLPLTFVIIVFATNCSEALVAAICVRHFSDAPVRFDTLRRMVLFIVGAALIAPFVSSFPDAAAVTVLLGEPYWQVWSTRFSSNVLTELTVVPALVILVTAGPSWLRRAVPRRRIEAGVLAVLLLGVGIVMFGVVGDAPRSVPAAPLAFLVPFIVWATVRFGPGGASLSLLATALIVVWAGTHALGPFTNLRLSESILGVQIFLTVVAIPIMCLAAVVEERRRAQYVLAERLRFEELLSRLSGAFVHLPSEDMDHSVDAWLQELGEFLVLDRVMLLQLSSNNEALVIRNAWMPRGCERGIRGIPTEEIPWIAKRLLREEVISFSRLDQLPREAARDREWLRRRGIVSSLILPLIAGSRPLGGLVLLTVTAETTWSAALVQRLGLVAAVFAHALARKETEDALRASELMKSAILESLSGVVVVLDRDGSIIAMNARTRLHERDRAVHGRLAVGVNYLELWSSAARLGSVPAIEARAGIEAVLAGARSEYALEYRCGAELPCGNGGGERWMAMSVVPLDRLERGAVVAHTDVTERKRAELELQRSRQELAHFTRVSTMGELTASLAHELSQPLTGILTNAQAARRFLDAIPPNLGELQSILADIVADERRAGEVVHRLRDFLRKGEPQRTQLDVNVLVRDVAKLLGSDAVIRNVNVMLELDARPLMVSGDRVQLQQVVMNLVINAMDATTDGAPGDRVVVLRTYREDVESAHVWVEDAGPGFRAGTEELVFEPFYTTKPTGMGMGLSIAKSIVQDHGGLIWATNNPTGGGAVHFALPLAGRSIL